VRYHISPHALGVGPLVSEQFRGLPEQFRDVLRRVFGEGMPHPLLQPSYHHAAAEGVNEKAVPDALGDSVRAFWNPGFGDHAPYLLVQSLFGQRPNPFLGGRPGPMMADAMHLIEEIKEGIRHRNGPRLLGVVRAGKAYHLGVKSYLLRREFHGLGEIAAGIMQQATKRSGFLIFRPVSGFNKGCALFFVEKQALSVRVEKMCSHLANLNEKQKIEKAPNRGPFLS
jgi:hypothetical protein